MLERLLKDGELPVINKPVAVSFVVKTACCHYSIDRLLYGDSSLIR